MSRSTGQVINDSLQLSLGYAHRLLTDVSTDRFARLSAPGGQTIQSNHPAFIYGHLSTYAPRILEDLGAAVLEIPDGFTELFAKDTDCQDDADGSIYPAQDAITEFFFAGYEAVAAALQAADESVYQGPNPLGGRMTELFPSLGSLHNFYVGGHVMIHMGQMSAWRRMEGLGPA
ncbi:MAG TPA: hypothetical protein DCG12_13570 [Planctomycetaceae bacterium]|nr:hypothetical protein [Planctomycetaceae bacterium]